MGKGYANRRLKLKRHDAKKSARKNRRAVNRRTPTLHPQFWTPR